MKNFDLTDVETPGSNEGTPKKDEGYYLAKFGNLETEEAGSDIALPLIIPGTLQPVPKSKKVGMIIVCTHTEGERMIYNGTDVKLPKRWTVKPGDVKTRCSQKRLVATSDLHQTQACFAHSAARDQAKGKARREAKSN